jgi:Zn-dependent protease with chaperone function
MTWLRCPHCAICLSSQGADDDVSFGCPSCGGVFSTAAARQVDRANAGTQAQPAEASAPSARVQTRSTSPGTHDLLYPLGPREVPTDLTLASPGHELRALLLLVTLALFFALYVGLLIGSGCLIFWSFRFLGVFGFPVAFLALALFLFLLKGFFKSEQQGKSLNVEITEAEQPRLFAFIRRVCEDTGAPPPHRVFLNPEVNAAAFYENSLLGLVRPTPKNLLLGLGLVNVLTFSEFKAVLAHEFGHFSQRSMKLGMYVYTANRVLLGMLNGRDWLEDLLLRFRAVPGFAGLIGFAIWGLFFALRQGMLGLFYGVNFLHSSLSREMEFHADLVAVSVTGSEAIVRGLTRLNFAGEALSFAAHELTLAAQHGLYSADLFIHQRDGMDYLRRQRKDPRLGEPPPLPADPMLAPEVFDPDDGPPSMWADHPSNYDRERNVKHHYVYCPLDDRSAWLLFDNRSDACERVTWRFYRVSLKVPRDTVLDEPEVVQKFIGEEHKALTYDPGYHGIYDSRFIELEDLDDLFDLWGCEVPAATVLEQRHAALYVGALPKRAAAYVRHREEWDRIVAFRREAGQDKDRKVVFRGKPYGRRDVQRLLKFIDEDLKKDCRKLAFHDGEILLVHYYMSRLLGQTALNALRERYTFHEKLQKILAALFKQQSKLESILAIASGAEGNGEKLEFQEVFLAVREARDVLVECLEKADKLRLPPLVHMKAGKRLGPFLWDEPVVRRVRWSRQSISGKQIQRLMEQLGKVIDRAQRIHFKSLGGILALQEEIGKRWLNKYAGRKTQATGGDR